MVRRRAGFRLGNLPPDVIGELSKFLTARNVAALARTNTSMRHATRHTLAQRRQRVVANARRLEPMMAAIQYAFPLLAHSDTGTFQMLPQRRVPGTRLVVSLAGIGLGGGVELMGKFGTHLVKITRRGSTNPRTFLLDIEISRNGKRVAQLTGVRNADRVLSRLDARVSRYMTDDDIQSFKVALKQSGVTRVAVETAGFQRNPSPL